MKTSLHHTFLLLAAGVILPAAGLFAQSPTPDATPSVSVPAADPSTSADTTTPAHGKHSGRRERMSVLTPAERQQLKAAHKKAKQDPAVQAAEATRSTDRKGYHKAMREAMLRADPSLGPIFEKMRENHPNRKNS